VKPEPEPGDNPEIATSASERPEEVGMGLGVGREDLTFGGHDLGGHEVVNREPVLANEVADPAPQGDTADAHRRGIPETGREPVGVRSGRVLTRG
jgi:hypothetical protein